MQEFLERQGGSLDDTGDTDANDARLPSTRAIGLQRRLLSRPRRPELRAALLRVVDASLAPDADPFAELRSPSRRTNALASSGCAVTSAGRDRTRTRRRTPSGELRYALKIPWKDGTVALLLEAASFAVLRSYALRRHRPYRAKFDGVARKWGQRLSVGRRREPAGGEDLARTAHDHHIARGHGDGVEEVADRCRQVCPSAILLGLANSGDLRRWSPHQQVVHG